jgi:pyrimidine operon attenuation protein/uracil phosphoribosyltransferase
MALIALLLEKSAGVSAGPRPAPEMIRFKAEPPPRCSNLGCITRFEGAYLVPRFTLVPSMDAAVLALKCGFCDGELKIEYVGHARSHRYYRFDENLQGYIRQWIEEGSLAVFDSVKQAEEAGYEPYRRGPQREIMNQKEVVGAIESLADQLIADVHDITGVSIVGVVSHGAMLALRLRDLVGAKTGVLPPCAALDAYKPDDALHPIDGAEIFNVEDRTIILVDDVINSGWTVQRAMATIWRRGRPAAVKLAVLIDRGHRAVPIRPNYVGKNIPSSRSERVLVRLAAAGADSKSHDRVMIYSIVEPLKEPEAAH